MSDPLLIFGATGFTGNLIVREALARGLRPVLGGRNLQKLEAMGVPAQLECRVAPLDDRSALSEMLRNMKVVLSAAGPFSSLGSPLLRTCLERSVHYLDVSGEIPWLEDVARWDAEARSSGIMLLPGAGFDVVPTDCLAALVTERLPGAQKLDIALTGLSSMSRGSAATILEMFDQLVTVRRNGELTRVAPGVLEDDFDFGRGRRRCAAISWGDVSTAFHSTGIGNVTVYHELNPALRLVLAGSRYGGWISTTPGWKWWRSFAPSMLPHGPTVAQRAAGGATVVVRATDAVGRMAEVRLVTQEVYSFTAASSVALADRVLGGNHKIGFQTPSTAYGHQCLQTLPGVRLY